MEIQRRLVNPVYMIHLLSWGWSVDLLNGRGEY